LEGKKPQAKVCEVSQVCNYGSLADGLPGNIHRDLPCFLREIYLLLLGIFIRDHFTIWKDLKVN
jgi:hypothetical protein